MSTPTQTTPTASGSDEFPVRIAQLPLPNGDRALVMFAPSVGWMVGNFEPVGLLAPALVPQLIHFEQVPTDVADSVPDDLVEQFRQQLKMKDDE